MRAARLRGRRPVLALSRILALALPLSLCAAGALAQESLVLTVVPFRTQAEPAYAFLGESFSETLTTKLVGIKGVKVYERSQFARIVEELALESNQTGMFDQDTVSRVGKVVSIDYMLMGSASLQDGIVSCDVRLVQVNTGKVALAQQLRGRYPQELFALQDKAALGVARALELRLSDFELRRLTRKPTEDADAFGLYNAGLLAKDTGERVKLIEKAVERDPGFTQALNLLADLYEDQGRASDAAGAYARVLAADPLDTRAAYNLALLRLDLGKPLEAEELLEACLGARGEDADVLYHLGLVHEYGNDGKRFAEGSDLAAAAAFYRLGVQADGMHAESRFGLGVVCASLAEASGDPAAQLPLVDEAARALKAYLELRPEAVNREEIAANVQMLERARTALEEYLAGAAKK